MSVTVCGARGGGHFSRYIIQHSLTIVFHKNKTGLRMKRDHSLYAPPLTTRVLQGHEFSYPILGFFRTLAITYPTLVVPYTLRYLRVG